MRLLVEGLPGIIAIERGMVSDYRALEHFHYARKRPATWAGVWRAVYFDFGFWICDCGLKAERTFRPGNPKSTIQNPESRVIGVAVLSWPTVSSRAREEALGIESMEAGERLRFVNANVRSISRVIVHPQFRGLGVAARLVGRVLRDCPTRFVEATAVMGEVHPFFEKGGMRRVLSGGQGGAAYFLFDRGEEALRMVNGKW